MTTLRYHDDVIKIAFAIVGEYNLYKFKNIYQNNQN